MALSTSNKILHMLVRPDPSEIQSLLPVFNPLPDFIEDNNKNTVGDKACDSMAHRTEFNTMGRFLYAENPIHSKRFTKVLDYTIELIKLQKLYENIDKD